MKGEPKALTHKALVRIVERWLRVRGHRVVLTEAKVLSSVEEPDAIAWKGPSSVLVEAKVSRADFLADRKKIFRAHPELGMGAKRYFAAPEGMVRPDELPPRWGLLEVTRRGVRVAAEALPQDRNVSNEIALLVSALERAIEGWGQGMFGEARQTTAAHPKLERQKARDAVRAERAEEASRSKYLAERDAPARTGPDPTKAFNTAFPKIPSRPR